MRTMMRLIVEVSSFQKTIALYSRVAFQLGTHLLFQSLFILQRTRLLDNIKRDPVYGQSNRSSKAQL